MSAQIYPWPPSRRLPRQSGYDRRQHPTPLRHVVEIVGLDRAVGDQKDALFRRTLGIAQTLLVSPHCADGDAELVGKSLLRPPLPLAPLSQFHNATAQSSVLPIWLYAVLALWQYANMAKGQIVYVRWVANDDEAPNRIQELIDAAGINQAELARRANVTVSALNKVVKGTRGLDQDWMRRLAPHLGVTPAELLPLSDNPMILDDAEREMIERLRGADRATRDQLVRVAEAILPVRSQSADAA